MRDEAIIRQKQTEQPRFLNFMWTVIADLYGDYCKTKGRQNISDSLKQLRHLLTNYDQDALAAFFLSI